MALAEEALSMLRTIGLDTAPRPVDQVVEVRRAPLGETDDRPYRHGGRIVCHCERVTATEIEAACTPPLAATDLDGVRRRTRALAGRCQGFFCSAEVCAIASRASTRPMRDWMALS
jgi:glycerol-3-phosphate dehydrogenase